MYFRNFLGQSAIEYLMTYGWMLLVVAVAGGAIFSVVQQQNIESISGFTGGDVTIDQFGTNSNGNLQMEVRNTAGDEVTVEKISVSGESSETLWSGQKEISVSESDTITVSGVSNGSEAGSIDVKITYSSGGLSNLAVEGSISGSFEFADSTEATGVVKEWEHSLHSNPVRSVHVSDGVVYSGGRDTMVYAVSAQDGSKIWEKNLGTVVNTVHENNGVVYAAVNGNNVFALDAEDGTQLWQHSYHDNAVRSVYGTDNGVYSNAGTYIGQDRVAKVNPSDGSTVWNHTHHSSGGDAITVEGSKVYSGSQSGTIVAAQTSDGSQVWNHSRHSSFVPALDASDSSLYSASDDNTVMSSDLSDGSENWVHNHHSARVAGIDYNDGVVYSGGNVNRTIAVDSSDGSQLWNHSLHNNQVSSVYQKNSKVYTAGSDNRVISSVLSFD